MKRSNGSLAEEQAQAEISILEDGSAEGRKAKASSPKKDAPVEVKRTKPASEKMDKPAEGKKTKAAYGKEDAPSGSKKVKAAYEREDAPSGSKKVKAISEREDAPSGSKKVKAAYGKEDVPSGSKKVRSVSEREDTPLESKRVRKISEKKDMPAGKKKVKRKLKKRAVPAGKKTKLTANEAVRPASGEQTKTSSGQKARAESQEDFESRMQRRDEIRARRREERKRKVRRQKIMMAVSAGVIAVAAVVVVVFCTPSVKLSLSLAKGGRYTEKEDYTNARTAYENALKIDTASVEAYRGMADGYVAQGKIQEAKQILFTGWEQTQDEGLLHYYCIELYNDAVREINAGECTLGTVDKCIQVLEQEPTNPDALGLMGTCYERLFRVEEDDEVCSIFFDADAAADTCSYTEYEQLLRRLAALYQSNPSEKIKAILTQYALIDMPYVQLSVPHLEAYMTMLTDVNGVVNDAGIADTIACLNRAKEVEEYFAAAFQEFEAGNYAYARELVVQESYQQIRDSFIEENSGYWEGSVYIPVNREQMVLHREEGKVRFSFPDMDKYENYKDMIKVWGTKQEDDGVQRSAISYVPAAENGAGSHTEYKVQYLYSNVKIGGQYVPQMNFRFDTEVTTDEGTTTNAIGDWGGEHEWEIDY